MADLNTHVMVIIKHWDVFPFWSFPRTIMKFFLSNSICSFYLRALVDSHYTLFVALFVGFPHFQFFWSFSMCLYHISHSYSILCRFNLFIDLNFIIIFFFLIICPKQKKIVLRVHFLVWYLDKKFFFSTFGENELLLLVYRTTVDYKISQHPELGSLPEPFIFYINFLCC